MPLPYGCLVNESAGRKHFVSVFPWTECYEDDSSSTESNANEPRANRSRVNQYSRRFPRNKLQQSNSSDHRHLENILLWPRSNPNDISCLGFSDSRSPWVVKCVNGSRVIRSKVEGTPWKHRNVNDIPWSTSNESDSTSQRLSSREIRTTSSENTRSGYGVSGLSERSSSNWSGENESIWSLPCVNGHKVNVSRYSAIDKTESRLHRFGVKLPGLYELANYEFVLNGSQANGSRVNGSQVNGSQVNGSQVNGSQVNGSRVNGSRVNGSQVDGSQVNGSQVNGSQVNESSGVVSAVNGSRRNDSPPRPRRWKRRAPRVGVGAARVAAAPGQEAPPMRRCARAAWRLGCGRRAGAVVGLLLALAGAAPALLQALEQAGALRALREAEGLPGAPLGAGGLRGGASLRAAHWALAAARAVELPLLLLALAGALAGRRRLVAPWLGWAPVAVAAGAAQTVLALVQVLRLAAREGLPLQALLAARMGLYAVAAILSSLASVLLVEGFRRGPVGSAQRVAAAREQRRSFELPPLQAPQSLHLNGHSHA